MKTNIFCLLPFIAVIILPMNACAETYTDDFNTDSGMWSYVSNAHLDSVNHCVILTENAGQQAGIAWLNPNITTDFDAEFSYKVGPNTGYGGGDGFVFMFYKQKGYTPASGGYLGFHDVEDGPVPGYGIEFDQFNNIGLFNETANHIALIKDSAGNHLATTGIDPRVSDNQWHNVEVEVKAPTITVYLDRTKVLNWSGPINKTFSGVGFSAGTYSAINQHVIDNFTITTDTTTSTTTSSTTTTTITQGCSMKGNQPPCNTIDVGEILDAITSWANGAGISVQDILTLITAWASGGGN